MTERQDDGPTPSASGRRRIALIGATAFIAVAAVVVLLAVRSSNDSETAQVAPFGQEMGRIVRPARAFSTIARQVGSGHSQGFADRVMRGGSFDRSLRSCWTNGV